MKNHYNYLTTYTRQFLNLANVNPYLKIRPRIDGQCQRTSSYLGMDVEHSSARLCSTNSRTVLVQRPFHDLLHFFSIIDKISLLTLQFCTHLKYGIIYVNRQTSIYDARKQFLSWKGSRSSRSEQLLCIINVPTYVFLRIKNEL